MRFDPQDAEVVSYYPNVTDGGPVSQRWITANTLVNPDATSVLDLNGNAVAIASVRMNALGHTALTVAQLFPNLPASFSGSFLIAITVPGTYCLALSADLGIFSSDPPSGLGWPVSQYDASGKCGASW